MNVTETTKPARRGRAPKPYPAYAEDAPSKLHIRFADWLMANTHVKPEDEASFRKGVQLATVLHGQYRKSPENKAATAAEKAARKPAPQLSPEEKAAKAAEAKTAKLKARLDAAIAEASALKAKVSGAGAPTGTVPPPVEFSAGDTSAGSADAGIW